MWRRIVVVMAVLFTLSVVFAGVALANSPGTQGQPNQSCGSENAKITPGNAVNAPGSAFNPDGTAGGVYAGQQLQNQKNPNSVSQYDVACFQVSQSHP